MADEEAVAKGAEDAINENESLVEDIDVADEKYAETEREVGPDVEAKLRELRDLKVRLQKNLTVPLMESVNRGKISPQEAQIAVDAFDKAYENLGPESKAGEIQEAIKDLEAKYGDQMRTLDTLMKATSWKLTYNIKKLVNYKLRNEVALKTVADRLNLNLEKGQLTDSDLADVKSEYDKASAGIDEDYPQIKEKVEAKGGSKLWKACKMMLILGSLIGSLFLIAHFLQEKYEGCYKMITKGDSVKLNCGVDQDHCGCGDSDATRNLPTATDAICAKYGDYPFCKGSCRGNPTCSSIDLMVQQNGVNYSWQSYTAFDSLLMGLNDGAKALSDDLGLGSVWKYVKYFIYGILGLVALVFIIWIIYEIWEHLPKKKEDHGSDVNIHVDSASTSSV